jgi:hypothetical protein
MATSRAAAIPAKAEVVTEKPGVVMVQAIATVERQNDGRPLAGFFVRRRYQGETFMIAEAKEFSPRWMRFVDEPPKEWHEDLKKILGGDIEDFMAESEEPRRRTPEQPFSMTEVSQRARTNQDIDYATGKIKRAST